MEQRGWQVDMGVSEEMLLQPGRLALKHDLYVLKSHTELTLSLACLLCTQGARVFHPYPSVVATQNKILAQQRLRAASVPVPRSWVTADFHLLEPLLDRFPLIIKPHQGYLGRGISVVHSREELARLPMPDRPVLIQEYIPGSGEDLKAYVVGDEVWAVHKAYSTESFAHQGTPCPVTREVRNIALRCGKALGLGIYGVDMVESSSGPVAVDVNYFPGFRGVPGVAPAIASYLDEFALGGHHLALPGALERGAGHGVRTDRSVLEAGDPYRYRSKPVNLTLRGRRGRVRSTMTAPSLEAPADLVRRGAREGGLCKLRRDVSRRPLCWSDDCCLEP
jgi:ribosomal protein S6--L-glutamate ligase